MQKATYELAMSLPENEDKRANAKSLKPRKFYRGMIEGRIISRTSAWWGRFKTLTEKAPCSVHIVYARCDSHHNKWDEIAATGAYCKESQQDYYRRVSGKPPIRTTPDPKREVVSNFLSSAW